MIDAGMIDDRLVVEFRRMAGIWLTDIIWTERWRSTSTHVFLQVGPTDLTQTSSNTPTLFGRFQYSGAGLMHSPMAWFAMGASPLRGQSQQKDETCGNAFRLNSVFQ